MKNGKVQSERETPHKIVSKNKDLNLRKREGELISAGDFCSYVLEIVKPAIEYFISHMAGPLEETCKGYRAEIFFDPYFSRRRIL